MTLSWNDISRAIFLLALACAVPWVSACGIEAVVQAKETISLSLDVETVLKQNNIDKNKVFPSGKVPAETRLTLPFWYRQTYDLRNNSDVRKYKDQIRDLTLKNVTYKIEQNSLNIEIPSQGKQMEVWVASLGKTEQTDFAKVGFLYAIPSGRTGITDRLYFDDNGKQKTTSLLSQFAIEFALKGNIVVDGSQNRTAPAGKIELEVTLEVGFSVDIKF
jgi:hypothetical protein